MFSTQLISAETVLAIEKIHQESISYWKHQGLILNQPGFFKLVEENHAFNFQLWHAEDRARRDDKGFEFVYQAKRDIDGFNQKRNNLIEAMDEFLFQILTPASPTHCPVHSETPGMIIDRLSILALKIYHMDEQTKRPEVDAHHRETCLQKWLVLVEQKKQLLQCLTELWQAIQEKKRTFRLYRQFKMYNDPKLNPELYQT